MQLTDTIVLVGAMNPKSEHHPKAKKYLSLVNDDQDTLVPAVSLVEFDLVMKGRNYTHDQRSDAFDWLSSFIPEGKIIPNSPSSLKIAVNLERNGLSYFDSLISAIAIEKDAIVLTTDEMISRVVQTEW